MNNKEGFSFISILIVINIILCVTGIYLYSINIEGLPFINIYTIVLLCLMGVQNIIMLCFQKDRKDPFVIILIITMLCYFMSRIDTLMIATIFFDIYIPPESYKGVKASDFNYVLLFIILSNAFIYLGSTSVREKIEFKGNNYIDRQYCKPWNLAFILLLLIPIYYFKLVEYAILGRISEFIKVLVLNFETILIAACVYYLINSKNVSNLNICISLLAVLLITVFRTMQGSRASFHLLMILILPAYLSLKEQFTIKIKYLIMIIPLLLLGIAIYFYGTQFRYQAINIGVEKKISWELFDVVQSRGDILIEQDPREILAIMVIPPIDRMGILDYSVDIIAHSELYNNVFNIEYYYKSIIDNVLTPGFDVFDVDKISKVTSYVGKGYSIPSKSFIISEGYRSDGFSIYGEYYALFGGFFALIFMFVSSYCFKKAYVMIDFKNNYALYVYRALILYFFFHWIQSYGMDWQMINIILLSVTAGIYLFIVKL